MDELVALTTLVRSFLTSGDERVAPVAEWLDELLQELRSLYSDIANGCLNGEVTIEDVSGLDEVLSSRPDLDGIIEIPQDIFPWTMLDFWLNEVYRRGWELFNIAISSVDVLEAKRISESVKSMRYPIR